MAKAATKKTAAATKATKGRKAPAKKTAATKAKANAKAKEPTKTEQRDARVITLKDKEFVYGGEGTTRRKSWDALAKAFGKNGKATVGEFKENGGAVKYLSRWEGAKAIAIA